MFTETKSRLGWRTGTSRVAVKQQLESLQSFDPAERARAGQQLVQLGLGRCAEPLLDHIANEFDNRVLAAVAGAVIDAPSEPKESRKAQQLREWAAAELERSALEEAFMGGGPDSFAFPPEPDFRSAGLEPEPEPLPVRVPVAAGSVAEPTVEAAPVEAAAESSEYRFEVPEPQPPPEPIEYRPVEPESAPESSEYRFEVPEPQPALDPIEYRFDAPAPVAEYQGDPPPIAYESDIVYEPQAAYEPQAVYDPVPEYISWRPPADADNPSVSEHSAGNGHVDTSWAEPAPFEPVVEPEVVEPEIVEAEIVEAEVVEEGIDPDPEPEAVECRFEAPAPIHPYPVEAVEEPNGDGQEDRFAAETDDAQEHRLEAPAPPVTREFRFEAPEPNGAASDTGTSTDTNAAPRTLAERLRARDA